MASTYSSNSSFQQESASSAIPEIRALVHRVLDHNHDEAFTLVDYGSGPSTSGLALFREVIGHVRRSDAHRELTVVHQDLLGNAWGDLVTRLRKDPESYLAEANPPPVLAAVGSFYRRCMPPRSVHLGMSFMAAHWMSTQQTAEVRGSAAVLDADRSDESVIAAQAATDWVDFWQGRENELADGGSIVVKCIGSLEDRSESTSLQLLRMLGEALQAAADDGIVTQAAADGFVLSEYPRTVAEARVPFDSGAVPGLRLDHVAVKAEKDPYRAQFAADGDASAYARRLSGFLRAFTETSVRSFLAGHAGINPTASPEALDTAVDWIYAWCRTQWQADPDAYPFEAWTLTVIAHRV